MNRGNAITIAIIVLLIGSVVGAILRYSHSINSHPIVALYRQGTYISQIQKQQALGTGSFNIQGTPNIILIDTQTKEYINMAGAYPQDTVQNTINQMKDNESFDSISQGGTLYSGGSISTQTLSTLRSSPYSTPNKETRFMLIEYSDVQCPVCQEYDKQNVIHNLKENNSDIQFVFQNFPLKTHAHAMEGAQALSFVYDNHGYDAFLDYKSALYALGKTLNLASIKTTYDQMFLTE